MERRWMLQRHNLWHSMHHRLLGKREIEDGWYNHGGRRLILPLFEEKQVVWLWDKFPGKHLAQASDNWTMQRYPSRELEMRNWSQNNECIQWIVLASRRNKCPSSERMPAFEGWNEKYAGRVSREGHRRVYGQEKPTKDTALETDENWNLLIHDLVSLLNFN